MPATLKLKTDGTNPCEGERKCDQTQTRSHYDVMIEMKHFSMFTGNKSNYGSFHVL